MLVFFVGVGKSGILVEEHLWQETRTNYPHIALPPGFERGPFRSYMIALITTLDCVGHEYENARETKFLKGR